MYKMFTKIYFYNKINLRIILPRYYGSTRAQPNEDDANQGDVQFFRDIFELPPKEEPYASKILKLSRKLIGIDKYELTRSSNILKSFNFPIEDIRKYPELIAANATTLDSRHQILIECGFKDITTRTLSIYLPLINKNLHILRLYKHIPMDLNVIDRLANQLHVSNKSINSEKIGADTSISEIRLIILKKFITKKLSLADDQLTNLPKIYPRIKHKSYKSVLTALDLLQNQVNLSDDIISRHLYLLHADPENIKNILENVKTLGGVNIIQLLHKRPKIFMTNYRALIKISKYLEEFEIPNESIVKCLEIFTLSPQTVYHRLCEIKSIKEFSALSTNARVLRLVHYQKKAIARLEFLKKRNVSCVSLNVLCSPSRPFERYAREGCDKTKGIDIVNYLTITFNINEKRIRDMLLKHPNWCYLPIATIEDTINYLLENGYTISDITDILYIILYPIDRIKEKLDIINNSSKDDSFLGDVNKLSATQRLSLCLYLIEYDFHFTGDGVWLQPQRANDSQGNHNNFELPTSEYSHFSFGRSGKKKAKVVVV